MAMCGIWRKTGLRFMMLAALHWLPRAVCADDLAKSVVATGKVEPITKVEVKSKASGIVKKLLVDYGDKVKKGNLLAVIDAPGVALDERAALVGVQQAKGLLRGGEALAARRELHVNVRGKPARVGHAQLVGVKADAGADASRGGSSVPKIYGDGIVRVARQHPERPVHLGAAQAQRHDFFVGQLQTRFIDQIPDQEISVARLLAARSSETVAMRALPS